MPKYRLSALGDTEFENLVQALLKRVIGAGTITFGPGRDGGREATFEGSAPYPSTIEPWSGAWIFQVKFHDVDLIGIQRARSDIVTDLKTELRKITVKYRRKCDNYILITNVPLSGAHGTGTRDRLDEAFKPYRQKIGHLAVWDANDINTFLTNYPEVRKPYLPLLVAGDVIAQLLDLVDAPRSERATTIDLYLRTAITREEHAQLDQAGDVSEERIPLQRIFFDLDAYIETAVRTAIDRLRDRLGPERLPFGQDAHTPVVELLINRPIDRAVLVGGPGEGKSTIGQYLAQLHRATLLNSPDEIALTSDYIPEMPRLPFRIVLRDLAQWLANRANESPEPDTLDSYICEHITRLSSRTFTEKDLHESLRTNPVILILDGLDEVTDATIRKRLLARVLEFIDRSENGLKCDLQVVATTRPTGYNDQFDPRTFIHFRLHKLADRQVRDYVQKWSLARLLDEGKATRLKQTIEECLADNQISLLMNTPLQVTILILIINSGGTPPRQREALFDEYLEVMYKREKAKGLGIVKSEKELLIGLHKHVGFLLQEKATRASTSSAVLRRPDYDRVVRGYLRHHDPYSPHSEIEEEWHAITVDAGERLVLIVESPADVFGFELRSIQEFFAACYLCDTAANTEERYGRFAKIANLSHWRNVTLFFAGRVGRRFSGEAAYIVEACRDTDRAGPDRFVRRGAEVALELAADRALEPKRVLQRSLLEHGLVIFESKVGASAVRVGTDLLRRLPYEDIRDHVLPVLHERLATAGSLAVSNICQALSAVAPESTLLRKTLLEWASKNDPTVTEKIIQIVSYDDIPHTLRLEVIRALLDGGAEADLLASTLQESSWDVLCTVAQELAAVDAHGRLRPAIMTGIIRSPFHFVNASLDEVMLPDAKGELYTLLNCARALGIIISTQGWATGVGPARRAMDIREAVAADLPATIIRGDFDLDSPSEKVTWFLWLTHLSLGKVTLETWSRFSAWRAEYAFSAEARQYWQFFGRLLSPVVLLATHDLSRGELTNLGTVVASMGGLKGFDEWFRRLSTLRAGLKSLGTRDRSKLFTYGPGSLADDARRITEQVLAQAFPECRTIYPIALEWLMEGLEGTRLSVEEFGRLSRWFAANESDSFWWRDYVGDRVLVQAIRVGYMDSSDMQTLFASLPWYSAANLAIVVALSDNRDNDTLRLTLSHPGLQEYARAMTALHVSVEPRDLRVGVLSFLDFVDDEDAGVRGVACLLISSMCKHSASQSGKRSPIRSRTLDDMQVRLATSNEAVRRVAGISLYAVRPPRSAADWSRLSILLKTATQEETRDYWSWIMPAAAELGGKAEAWIEKLTAILDDGVEDWMHILICEVLRGLLPRQDQGIIPFASELGISPSFVDAG